MTWDEIADEQIEAAKILIAKKRSPCIRAICSRAYYGAYAIVASRAPAALTYPHGWNNPAHAQLSGIVDTMRGVDKPKLKQALNRLRLSRIDADYRVVAIGSAEAKDRLRDCLFVSRQVRER